MRAREEGTGRKHARNQERAPKSGGGDTKKAEDAQGKNTNGKNTNRCRKRGGGEKAGLSFCHYGRAS